MNVLQLLTTVDVQKTVIAHNDAYPKYPISVEQYRDTFLPLIRKKIIEQTGYIIEVAHYHTKHADPVDDEERIDVNLLDKGVTYSLSFIPWGEILGGEVLCVIPQPFTPEQQAAHIYWEMTWHGYEEATEKRRDELTDQIEEAKEVTEQITTSGNDTNLPKGFDVITDVFEDLFPDMDPEEKAQLRAESDRRLINLRTEKVYKNGVLQNKLHGMLGTAVKGFD